MNSQVDWDVTFCRCVSTNSRRFDLSVFIFRVKENKKNIKLESLIL